MTLFIAVLLSLLLAPLAQAAEYYLSPTGTNSNSCAATSPGTARRHFSNLTAASCLNPGDTVWAAGGNYGASDIQILGTPSGTATQLLSIKAQTPTNMPIFRELGISQGAAYIFLENLIFDRGGTTDTGCAFFGSGAHHITWDGGECRNSGWDGISMFYGGGYDSSYEPHHITIRHLKVHHNGQSMTDAPFVGHGLYMQGYGHLIEENEIYSNSGGGIQHRHLVSDGYSPCSGPSTFRNNRIHNNATGIPVSYNSGIQMQSCDNMLVYNNVVYDEPSGGIQIADSSTAGVKIFNNTLYNIPG